MDGVAGGSVTRGRVVVSVAPKHQHQSIQNDRCVQVLELTTAA